MEGPTIRCLPYDQGFVEAVRAAGPDADGRPAERETSDADGNACRSCLRDVSAGRGMLVLAAMPFPVPQPYAEVGPIFMCAERCTSWDREGLPPILATSSDYLLRACDADHRIVRGTGRITPADEIAARAAEVFTRPEIAYIDVRSARDHCFQTRITRSP